MDQKDSERITGKPKLYRFNHSVSTCGFLYCHKIKEGSIDDKKSLRLSLQECAGQFALMDVSIMVYDSIFFFFFASRTSIALQTIIDGIQIRISSFDVWDENYVFSGVDDLIRSISNHKLKIEGLNTKKADHWLS